MLDVGDAEVEKDDVGEGVGDSDNGDSDDVGVGEFDDDGYGDGCPSSSDALGSGVPDGSSSVAASSFSFIKTLRGSTEGNCNGETDEVSDSECESESDSDGDSDGDADADADAVAVGDGDAELEGLTLGAGWSVSTTQRSGTASAGWLTAATGVADINVVASTANTAMPATHRGCLPAMRALQFHEGFTRGKPSEIGI